MKTLPLACCTTPKWSVKDLFCFYVMTENGKYEKHRLVEIALIFLKRHQVICKYVTHFLLTFRYGKRKRVPPPPFFSFLHYNPVVFLLQPRDKTGLYVPHEHKWVWHPWCISFQAIQNPNDEALQEKAWAAVVPLVGKLKKFYEFSQRLGMRLSAPSLQ